MLGFFLDYQTHELIDQNLPNQDNLHILKQTPLKYSKIELNLTQVFAYSLPKPTKRTPNLQHKKNTKFAAFSLVKKTQHITITTLDVSMIKHDNNIKIFSFYFYFFKKTLCLRANSSS